MNPIERLNAARNAWNAAKAYRAYARAMLKPNGKAWNKALDAADVAHDAYLAVLEEVTKELSLLAQWDVKGCHRCYGTGLEPALDGDQGLEFTWQCPACAGDGMARKKRWLFEECDYKPDNFKDEE